MYRPISILSRSYIQLKVFDRLVLINIFKFLFTYNLFYNFIQNLQSASILNRNVPAHRKLQTICILIDIVGGKHLILYVCGFFEALMELSGRVCQNKLKCYGIEGEHLKFQKKYKKDKKKRHSSLWCKPMNKSPVIHVQG